MINFNNNNGNNFNNNNFINNNNNNFNNFQNNNINMNPNNNMIMNFNKMNNFNNMNMNMNMNMQFNKALMNGNNMNNNMLNNNNLQKQDFQFKNALLAPTAINTTKLNLDESNIKMKIEKMNMMNKGKKMDQMNKNNFNNINNFNNNFNNNNIFNINNNFNNNFNNNNSNSYMYTYLNDIYNKINNRNFTSPPNFKNLLSIESLNISNENRQILKEILKSVKIVYITPLEILYKEQYDLSNKTSKERDKCPICLCEFYDNIIPDINNIYPLKPISEYIKQEIDVVKLYKCEDHFYHIECLNNLIKDKQGGGFKCAMCQKIYGILEGSMPPGSMKAYISKSQKCSGYHDYTIVIDYNIPSGKLPNGQYFTGTSRRAYLPNNKEGREILALLKIAFDRKLTFVVGTSVTTGQKNTVVWNGIHHKTNLYGGTQSYGYPDPTYFSRVKEELAAKGVSAEDFTPGQLEQITKNMLNGY